MLKLSLYGILRLILPILPKAYYYLVYVVYVIGVITIIYASFSTLRTIDVKELIAYSSVSHAAVYLLGVFSNSVQGIEGGIILGLAHGFVSSGLFICAGGILYDRSGTRLITCYTGIAQVMPLFSILFFLLSLGNCGVPLTLNFIGEFMSLYGMFEKSTLLSVFASSSIIFSAAYTIYMYNRISFAGAFSKYFIANIPDLTKREFIILITLILFTFVLGVYPAPVLDGLHYSVSCLIYFADILLYQSIYLKYENEILFIGLISTIFTITPLIISEIGLTTKALIKSLHLCILAMFMVLGLNLFSYTILIQLLIITRIIISSYIIYIYVKDYIIAGLIHYYQNLSLKYIIYLFCLSGFIVLKVKPMIIKYLDINPNIFPFILIFICLIFLIIKRFYFKKQVNFVNLIISLIANLILLSIFWYLIYIAVNYNLLNWVIEDIIFFQGYYYLSMDVFNIDYNLDDLVLNCDNGQQSGSGNSSGVFSGEQITQSQGEPKGGPPNGPPGEPLRGCIKNPFTHDDKLYLKLYGQYDDNLKNNRLYNIYSNNFKEELKLTPGDCRELAIRLFQLNIVDNYELYKFIDTQLSRVPYDPDLRVPQLVYPNCKPRPITNIILNDLIRSPQK